MIDAPAVLRAFLVADAPLVALTNTRIWAEATYPPSSASYKPATGAAIAFKSAGGPGLQAADTILAVRWQFKLYGPDEYAIRNAYQALVTRLHNVRGRGGILTSSLEVPGTMLTEQDTEWPFMLTYFVTRMRSRLPEPV